MLEIPESNTIARQMRDKLLGRAVTQVIAAQSPHGFAWYFGEPSGYSDLLCGKRISGVAAVGGHVEAAAEDVRIVLQDGVNIRYVQAGEPLPKKHQLYIGFEDGCGIVCTVQMYGGMYVYPEGANDNPYYVTAVQKPSPLAEEFDEAYFEQLLREANPKLSAKALVATEQRIPGVGNGCLQDILYNARIHPQTKLSDLRDEEYSKLFTSIKETLGAMTAGGGRDTEKDMYGKEGGYRTLLSNKTLAYACGSCDSGIIRKAYMGGNVYFCPVCQPRL